jgi:signal transduction histidine kinase
VVFCVLSVVVLNSMGSQLRIKEESYISLWASAMSRIGDFHTGDPIAAMIVDGGNTIPFIMTNDRGTVELYHLIADKTVNNPELLQRKIDRLADINPPIEVRMWNGSRHWVFYGKSRLLKSLTYFPFVQIFVILLLSWLGAMIFQSGKASEQNRVWVGLAKETAHQLGTPTSSLLGWIEYLKTQPVDQEAVEEMGKDLAHLMKVTDRFSKIGSETPLEAANINEVVGETVMYFRKRIPNNVTLNYNGLAMAPVRARINPALFEWVIENLLKNALDALQGKGTIDVRISRDERHVFIDVRDTGKGIPRANFKKIFEPGFTTKTRGWGLGLSLSHRVIEEYHRGRIFVADSEIGKGTTIRVSLNLLHG